MRKPTISMWDRRRLNQKMVQSKTQSVQADPLEIIIARAAAAGAPIQMEGAPPMYLEEDSEMRPYTDIKTDRFDLAIELMEKGDAEGAQNAMTEKDAEGKEQSDT